MNNELVRDSLRRIAGELGVDSLSPGVPAYDPNGLPVDLLTAGWLLGQVEDRRVEVSELVVAGQPVTVSTVFLVLDHAHQTQEHIPSLWETMVFGGTHDHRVWRYTSLEEAQAGHREVVTLVLADEPDDNS